MDLLAVTLSTLPSFLAYFLGGGTLIAGFTVIYVRITPHPEIALIREGNVAAAVAMLGALVGFVLPLSSVIAHSAHLLDLLIWGIIALIVQLGGYFCARLVFPGLSRSIADGQVSQAIFLAGLSLSLGILTAACMAG